MSVQICCFLKVTVDIYKGRRGSIPKEANCNTWNLISVHNPPFSLSFFFLSALPTLFSFLYSDRLSLLIYLFIFGWFWVLF